MRNFTTKLEADEFNHAHSLLTIQITTLNAAIHRKMQRKEADHFLAGWITQLIKREAEMAELKENFNTGREAPSAWVNMLIDAASQPATVK